MSLPLKIPSLDKLIHELSKLPGLGVKTSERLALSIMKKSSEDVESLCSSLQDVKRKIRECQVCFAYTENESVCDFCEDPHRLNESLLCVVKSPVDIAKVESSGVFKGRYHVLHGCIAPLNGVGPEQLRMTELVDRVKNREGQEHEISEVVLALDSDLEGDTTGLYIKDLLCEFGVEVSQLAQGVPLGTYIDFVDQRTLGRALENRVKL